MGNSLPLLSNARLAINHSGNDTPIGADISPDYSYNMEYGIGIQSVLDIAVYIFREFMYGIEPGNIFNCKNQTG